MIDAASPGNVELTADHPADAVPDPFDRVAEEFARALPAGRVAFGR